MSARVVKRRHPNLLSVGDTVEIDGRRTRVVETEGAHARGFVLVAPVRRKRLELGTEPVFWRDLVRLSDRA